MAPFPLLFFLDLCYKSRLFKLTFLQEIFPVPLSSGFGAHPNLTYFTVYYHILPCQTFYHPTPYTDTQTQQTHTHSESSLKDNSLGTIFHSCSTSI